MTDTATLLDDAARLRNELADALPGRCATPTPKTM